MLNNPYRKLWQRLHASAKKKGFPLRAMFELTYRCNFRCRHCYVPFSYRKSGELKTKQIFKVLDQLKDIGCFYLGFTGGEPFLRKDIMDILWYAKRSGFEVIVYTNGSLINDKLASELASLRPNKIDITLPAMSKASFERIVGVKDCRGKVFKAIKLLHKKGVNLGFKTCVLKENQNEIKEIVSFAESLGALHRLDDMPSSRLDGSKEPYKYRGRIVGDRGKTEKPSVCRTRFSCKGDTAIGKTKNFFECGTGKNQVAITPLGEIKFCVMIDYPKLKILETSFQNVWKKLKNAADDIKKIDNYECEKCRLEPYCQFCPAKAWFDNRGLSVCDLDIRSWIKSRYMIHEN